MISVKFTRYGHLPLDQAMRNNLSIKVGDKYKYVMISEEPAAHLTLYLTKTNTRHNVITVEEKKGSVYMRLDRCLTGSEIKLPCYGALISFNHMGQHGFKITFVDTDASRRLAAVSS